MSSSEIHEWLELLEKTKKYISVHKKLPPRKSAIIDDINIRKFMDNNKLKYKKYKGLFEVPSIKYCWEEFMIENIEYFSQINFYYGIRKNELNFMEDDRSKTFEQIDEFYNNCTDWINKLNNCEKYFEKNTKKIDKNNELYTWFMKEYESLLKMENYYVAKYRYNMLHILKKYNNILFCDKSDIIKEIQTGEYYQNKILALVKEQEIYVSCDVRNPVLQNAFRDGLINRFNKCIISNMHFDVCEACHIIPFSESKSFDIDNGLLLNCILHKLFDNYEFSINPVDLIVEVCEKSNNFDYLKQFNKKYIKSLDIYTKTKELLKTHYGIFKEKTKLSSTIYEYVVIKGIEYIKLGSNVYTITDDNPDKLYGTITPEGKFKPISKNDKIIVKGRSKDKTMTDLDAELDAELEAEMNA